MYIRLSSTRRVRGKKRRCCREIVLPISSRSISERESCVRALLPRKVGSTESALRRDVQDPRREVTYASGTLGLVHAAQRVASTCSDQARRSRSKAGRVDAHGSVQ